MNPEDLSIEELQKLLEQKREEQKTKSDEIDNDFTVSRSESDLRRKRPVRGGKNTWVAEGEHRDVETPEVTPTPRNRKSPVKIEKKCHICGKSFKVNAALVSGEFIRCDSCTG